MPRNPKNRRVEILLSPDQYKALLKAAEAEGYITLLPKDEGKYKTEGSVAEFLRDHLSWTIPDFAKATPLTGRGKFKRNKDDAQ
jgi:hypothetical protein